MIHVVDYGASNICSVLNMLKQVGDEALPCCDVRTHSTVTKVLLPGMGGVDNATQKLQGLHLIEVLRERTGAGIPLLAICLGMQLLTIGSDESVLPDFDLDLIHCQVHKFLPDKIQAQLNIPYTGWKRIHSQTKSSQVCP